VVGSVIGSLLNAYISSALLQLIFSAVVLYSGVMMLIKRENKKPTIHRGNTGAYFTLAALISLAVGVLAALVGLGGGIFIIPILYLLFGESIDTARGTSTMTIGFAAAAAAVVYLFKGQLDTAAAAPVILGVALGGTAGGRLGTGAKPIVVKIIFFVIMLYISYKLGSQGLKSL
ncbi:MAG: sulfite exporter TauE/SafE family protein, partial [Candidatus Zixiibacteriota bacterium]